MTTDQAQRLRILAKDVSNDARIIAISSGKGGVGKTNFTVNLAIALSNLGKRVTIIDADLGLANVDVLLGLVPEYSLANIIRGEKTIEDVVVEGPNGIKVVSGGSGVTELIDLNDEELNYLIDTFTYFNTNSDYILIDTGAGISKSVLSFVEAATETIVITTPDPASITDAYALIKNITLDDKKMIKIIVNKVESNEEGDNVFLKLKQATERFLHRNIENLGYVFEDTNLKKAAKRQKAVIEAFPKALSSKGIEAIAFNLENNNFYSKDTNSFKSFLGRLIRKI